jgi:hypothetical protein
MIDLIDLMNTMAQTFQMIPELMVELAPANPVVAYIDSNPIRNSIIKARYQMQPGTLLIAWLETLFREGEPMAWGHRIEIYVRALRDHSDLALIQLLTNGVPNPGNGLRWRYCPLIDHVTPTNILSSSRVTDEEGIDYAVVLTETLETGDI